MTSSKTTHIYIPGVEAVMLIYKFKFKLMALDLDRLRC